MLWKLLVPSYSHNIYFSEYVYWSTWWLAKPTCERTLHTYRTCLAHSIQYPSKRTHHNKHFMFAFCAELNINISNTHTKRYIYFGFCYRNTNLHATQATTMGHKLGRIIIKVIIIMVKNYYKIFIVQNVFLLLFQCTYWVRCIFLAKLERQLKNVLNSPQELADIRNAVRINIYFPLNDEIAWKMLLAYEG